MNTKRLSSVMAIFLMISVLIPVNDAKAYQVYRQGALTSPVSNTETSLKYRQGNWSPSAIPTGDLTAHHQSKDILVVDSNAGPAISQPNIETGLITSSRANQISDFLFYDSATGRACFWDLFKGAYCYSNWPHWSQIVPGIFTRDGLTDVLLYDTDGRARFIASTGDGGYWQLSDANNWRHWTHIAPGYFNPDKYTDLLLYDTDGTALIITPTGDGGHWHLSEANNWRHTWSQIVTGYFNKYDYADPLLYDNSDGTALILAASENGKGEFSTLKEHTNWRHTWSQIVPGYFNGDDYTDLLLYDSTDGTALFIATNGKGDYTHLREFPNWRHWTNIVPANFNGDKYTDLLLYDSTDGTVGFITTNGKGDYASLPINKITNLGHWTHIVPGNFITN